MNEKISQLTDILQESDNIVFFGGAGVSTASNIPDFRSSNGLYSQKLGQNFTPEQLVSHTFFVRLPFTKRISYIRMQSQMPAI